MDPAVFQLVVALVISAIASSAGYWMGYQNGKEKR